MLKFHDLKNKLFFFVSINTFLLLTKNRENSYPKNNYIFLSQKSKRSPIFKASKINRALLTIFSHVPFPRFNPFRLKRLFSIDKHNILKLILCRFLHHCIVIQYANIEYAASLYTQNLNVLVLLQ